MKFNNKFTIAIFIVFIFSTAIIPGEKNSGSLKTVNSLADRVLNWKFKTDGKIYASPIVHNNVLYIGSFDSCFYAVDIKTGKEIWHFNSGEQILSTAAIFENTVAFESGNIFYGLDLNGNIKWTDTLYSTKTVNQQDEWDYFHSSPLLVDSIAYLGTEKGLFYGINMKTGKIDYQCQTPEAKFTIKTKPAVFNNSIYFGDWDGVFYNFDLSSGKMNWEYDTKKDKKFSSWVNAIQTDPVIYNNSVYFAGRSCTLYSLDAVTGKKNWSFSDPNSMWLLGGPTIDDSTIYIGSSNQHFIQAFNVYTGALKWKRDVDYRIFGKPFIDGDLIYFGTGNEVGDKFGSFYAVDKKTGVIIERISVDGQLHSSPSLVDGTFYFGCSDTYIYAVNQSKYKLLTYADSYLKDISTIKVTLSQDSTYKNSVFIYNRGDVSDSIVVTSSFDQMKVEPSVIILAPKDSQEVKMTINAANMAIGRSIKTVTFTGYNSLARNSLSKQFSIQIITAVDNSHENTVKSFNLKQNYPNPFNPTTTISYELPKPENVELKVFDIFGREVETLFNKKQSSGMHQVEFNAGKLASGTYFYRIIAGSFVQAKKMILLK